MSRSGPSRASSGAPWPTFRESLIGDGELTQCDFVFTSLFCIATDKSELIDGHHIKPRRQANRSVHTPLTVILQITKSHVFYVRSINISLFSCTVKTCVWRVCWSVLVDVMMPLCFLSVQSFTAASSTDHSSSFFFFFLKLIKLCGEIVIRYWKQSCY